MKSTRRIHTSKLSALNYFFLAFLLASGSVKSEIRHSELLNTIQTQKKRPPKTDTLSAEEVLFLTEGYFRSEDSIEDRYNNQSKKPELYLPSAITEALKNPKSEASIAEILADLSGSLNLKQISKLKDDSAELAQVLRDKEPVERDLRLLALIERSEWIGYILEGKLPPASRLPSADDEKAFQNFKEEFLKSHEQVMKTNKELLEAINEAKSGNKTQKERVRKELDFNSLEQYLKGQVEFGGEALAQDLAQAISWKDEAGNFYHDVTSKDGQDTKRVFVSELPKENLSQLMTFFKKQQTNPSQNPLRISPTKFTHQDFENVNLTGSPLKGTSLSTELSQSLRSRAKALVQGKCVSCHYHSGGISADQFSQAYSFLQSGRMPKDPVRVSPEEKKLLLEYFSKK